MSRDNFEIQKADPAARRNAVLLVLAAMIAGTVLIALGAQSPPGLVAWVREDYRTRLAIVIVIMLVVVAAPPLGLAVYLWRLARRTLSAERFPPPGSRVVHDTPILTGDSALARGRMLQVMGAMIGMGALLIALALLRLGALAWNTPA
jgi:hypothetical protein